MPRKKWRVSQGDALRVKEPAEYTMLKNSRIAPKSQGRPTPARLPSVAFPIFPLDNHFVLPRTAVAYGVFHALRSHTASWSCGLGLGGIGPSRDRSQKGWRRLIPAGRIRIAWHEVRCDYRRSVMAAWTCQIFGLHFTTPSFLNYACVSRLSMRCAGRGRSQACPELLLPLSGGWHPAVIASESHPICRPEGMSREKALSGRNPVRGLHGWGRTKVGNAA